LIGSATVGRFYESEEAKAAFRQSQGNMNRHVLDELKLFAKLERGLLLEGQQ
jgi:hypothetical protein